MTHSKRNAFTLVELLVVITIIGMLMALLLPAISSATASARSLKCKNRLKQLATAMSSYESTFQAYPGYMNGTQGSGGVQYSWLVELMGELERGNIKDAFLSNGLPENKRYLEMLTCPSSPPLDTKAAHTAYVANAGFAQYDLAGCGMLNNRFPTNKPGGGKIQHMISNLDKVSSGDGASSTILFSEKLAGTSATGMLWDRPPFAETVKNEAKRVYQKNGDPHTTMVWHNVASPGPEYLINSKLPASDPLVQARPSSEHSGGVNVAFADGHVIFLKETVAYNVYARLLSPDGKKCDEKMVEAGVKSNIGKEIVQGLPVVDTDYQ